MSDTLVERPGGTWGDLTVDSYLRDATGTVWRVCAIDDRDLEPGMTGHLRCRNRENVWVTIAPKPAADSVTVLEVSDGSEHVIALLRDRLGASVLATQSHATRHVTCPDWGAMRAKGVPLDEFRAHLDLGHRMYATDIRTYAKLVEAHKAAHDPSQPHVGKLGLNHTHR